MRKFSEFFRPKQKFHVEVTMPFYGKTVKLGYSSVHNDLQYGNLKYRKLILRFSSSQSIIFLLHKMGLIERLWVSFFLLQWRAMI